MQTITHNNFQGSVISTGMPADPLDQLASKAAQQEAADNLENSVNDPNAPAAPGEAQAAPGMTNAQCFSMLLEMVRDVLCSFAKVESPKTTLSADKIEPAAEALGAVADKYGLSLAGAAGNYMVEIKAALVVVPILLAFRAGLVQEIAADKAKRAAVAGTVATLVASSEPAPLTGLHVVG